MFRITMVSLSLCLLACGQPPPGATTCDVTLTGAYPDTAFSLNAAEELALLNRLNALNAPMRAAELDAGVTTDRATLDRLYADGALSLKGVTEPAFLPVMNDTFTAFLAAQGALWTPATPPPPRGGIYGAGTSAWIFSERGVDLRQLMDKGLYGAAFYAEAARRLPTATTPESIDQLVALYGTTPAFPQNDTLPTGKDELAAKYAKRRTPPGVSGPYTRIRDAFVQARLASTSARCEVERRAALDAMVLEWEQVLSTTTVFYLYSAAAKLEDPNAALTTRASALHDLGEGAGFLLGLKAVPQARRRITDAQLDAALAAMRIPSLAGATAHQLVTVVPPDVEGLLSAATRIQQAYGLTSDDVTRIKSNF